MQQATRKRTALRDSTAGFVAVLGQKTLTRRSMPREKILTLPYLPRGRVCVLNACFLLSVSP